MKIDKKYLDIINDTDCWHATQLAEAFATDISTEEKSLVIDFHNGEDIIKISPDKEKARKIYQIILDKAISTSDIINIAGSILNNLKDKKWVVKLYKQAIQKANTTSDILSLPIAGIANEDGEFKDKKWAKEILLLGLDLCVTFDDYSRLSGEIFLALDDTKWALDVLSVGEKYARTSFDFKELGATYSGGYNMDPVDMEKARKFLRIAVSKIEGNAELYEITRHVCQDLKDKVWAKELYKEQLEPSKGFNRTDSYTLVNIANCANIDLNDREFAEEIFILAIDESKNNPDEVDYIIESVEDEWGYNDKILAQKLKKKYKK